MLLRELLTAHWIEGNTFHCISRLCSSSVDNEIADGENPFLIRNECLGKFTNQIFPSRRFFLLMTSLLIGISAARGGTVKANEDSVNEMLI